MHCRSLPGNAWPQRFWIVGNPAMSSVRAPAPHAETQGVARKLAVPWAGLFQAVGLKNAATLGTLTPHCLAPLALWAAFGWLPALRFGSALRTSHVALRIASLRSPFGQPAAGYLRFASVPHSTLHTPRFPLRPPPSLSPFHPLFPTLDSPILAAAAPPWSTSPSNT